MTKSKPVAPKPVLAWCVVNFEGDIITGPKGGRTMSVYRTREEARCDAIAEGGDRVVPLVELIRPAPKRKGAKP